MAVLSTALQVVGLALLAVGFGLWLGWAAFCIAAGACAVIYGMALEPLFSSKEQDDGTGTAD